MKLIPWYITKPQNKKKNTKLNSIVYLSYVSPIHLHQALKYMLKIGDKYLKIKQTSNACELLMEVEGINKHHLVINE